MRHPHGLRAAVGNLSTGPQIGDFYEGGYFAGYISHTGDSIATHGLIVAAAADGYNGGTTLQWKTTNTSTTGTANLYDGAANSANMNDANHPAAQYCEGLTVNGYSDWYLPALYELSIAYDNLKPTTTSNNTSYGINPYSVPERTANRTAGDPAQTTSTIFQSGNSEAFISTGVHWTSSEFSSTAAYTIGFDDGTVFANVPKNTYRYVRAFRKFSV